MRAFTVLIATALVCLVGCATQKPSEQYTGVQLEALKNNVVPSDVARIYLYKGTYVPIVTEERKIPFNPNLYINGTLVGTAFQDEALVVDIAPGNHLMEVGGLVNVGQNIWTTKTQIERYLEPGKVLILRADFKISMAAGVGTFIGMIGGLAASTAAAAIGGVGAETSGYEVNISENIESVSKLKLIKPTQCPSEICQAK
jgi:hypothetical protein